MPEYGDILGRQGAIAKRTQHPMLQVPRDVYRMLRTRSVRTSEDRRTLGNAEYVKIPKRAAAQPQGEAQS